MNIPYVMRKCTCCGEWLVASTVNFYRNKRSKCGLESQCKECKKNYDKQWQRVNKSRKAKNNKQYRKQYYKANKKKELEYNKQYYQSPQGKVVRFNNCHRRRIKEEQQGTGITKDQWLEMMKYFDWKCAYSGERLTDKTRSIDHIVPIDAGGDNMVWNMVPMTRSLNSSKNAKNMLEWYREQDCYSEARLQKIYEWQEYAYNKWGKDSEYFNSGNIQIKLI